MKISTVTLNSITWTDFVCPAYVDNFNILNVSGQVMDFRTDKNNIDTQISVQDMQFTLPDLPAVKNTKRYSQGDIIGSAKLQAGAGDVKVITH